MDVVSYGQLFGCIIIIIFKVSLIDGRWSAVVTTSLRTMTVALLSLHDGFDWALYQIYLSSGPDLTVIRGD
jgi:hypothetical protein